MIKELAIKTQVLERENEYLIEGSKINVLSSIGNEIKGVFIGWKYKCEENDERFLLIEQTYENYILSLSRLLDSNDLTLEQFKTQISEKVYERNKIRKIDERSIFRLNDTPYY